MSCKAVLLALVMIFSAQGFSQTPCLTLNYNHRTFSSKSSSLTRMQLTTPARTFIESVKQAAEATRIALNDGEKLLEVEFPPLPLEYLEDSSSSAQDIARANTRWAVNFAQQLAPEVGKISIIYPDQPELDDAIRYVDEPNGANPFPNVTLATIRSDSIRNAKSIDQIVVSIFGATIGGTVEVIPETKLYIALVSSTQELPDLEKLHNLDPTVPLVLFNLRLDFLRGDLGLPLFPGRDLHRRFLSRARPAYIMRSRSFSTSLRKPPFIVNYSGLLFRAYPEPFQSILNVGNGKTKLVGTNSERPTSAKFRDELTSALRVPGISADELRTKGAELWWEKESGEDVSKGWKS